MTVSQQFKINSVQVSLRRKQGRRQRPRKTNKQRVMNHIPMLLNAPTFNHTFRFTCTAALNQHPLIAVWFAGLIQVAATAIVSYPIFNTFRIRSITIWGAIPQALTPVTVSVEYLGGNQFDSKRQIVSDTSIGSNSIAVVKARPNINSSANYYQGISNNIMCYLNAPINSIVDVNISSTIINNYNQDQAPSGIVIAGGTVGEVYYGRLDGPTGSVQPLEALFI